MANQHEYFAEQLEALLREQQSLSERAPGVDTVHEINIRIAQELHALAAANARFMQCFGHLVPQEAQPSYAGAIGNAMASDFDMPAFARR